METKDLYQEVILPGTPQQVYDCYINSEIHGEITGGEADIDARAGGAFSAYNGYATGIIKELEPGRRIVQSWRADEADWPEDHFSEIIMELAPHADGCMLRFTQTAIPASQYDAIAQGWHEYYWEPMEEYLQQG